MMSISSSTLISLDRIKKVSSTRMPSFALHPTVPPKVEYTLTDGGRELREALLVLSGWSERHGPRIITAQEAYDREHQR
jgi:DNA-binding HxlR family transcriptional regulator